MTIAGLRRLIVLLVIVGCSIVTMGHPAGAGVVGGTTISNVASATFSSSTGSLEAVSSNTVTTVVASIGAISVSPKQAAPNAATDSFPAGSAVVRTFTISNSSNIPDAYTLTALTASAGRITSIMFVTPAGTMPVTIGSTVSPVIAPGGSIQVVVTVATPGMAVGTQIAVDIAARTTVTSTANGLQADSGQLWAVTAVGPSLGGMNGTTIEKYVQNTVTVPSAPGSTVTYKIMFKNTGGSAATNVVLSDTVPASMRVNVATVKINDVLAGAKAALDGQKLTVAIGTITSGAPIVVAFDAAVDSQSPIGTSFVNVASISADGIAAIPTSPAVVLIGFSNIVFDGLDGQKHPVAGAVVSLVNDKTGAPVTLATPDANTFPAGSTNVNAANANPFTTGPDGVYAFYFTAAQLGATAAAQQTSSTSRSTKVTTQAVSGIDLKIVAPNYTKRLIGFSISQSSSSPELYDATLTSKDGMPLASAGGFTLVQTGVSLNAVFGILGNIPMFAPRPVSITKTADRTTVSAGDRVVFTLQYSNAGNALGATSIADTLPAGLAYAPGTGRVDGIRVEPALSGRTLTWAFPTLDSAQHTIVYATVVVPGVQENSILTNVATINALPVGGNLPITATARAQVNVVAGMLSERSVITGRVYLDTDASGRFHRGDSGVAGVRIFLEDGESVTTDKNGRYSFPGVRPGMHALRVDSATLPPTVAFFAHSGADDQSSQRLVHGIMDSFLIQDINFALRPVVKAL